MSEPSSSRIIFRYFQLIALKSSPNNLNIVQILTFRTSLLISSRTHFSSSPNVARIFDKLYPNAEFSPNRNFIGFRYFSLKNAMGSKNLVKDAANPAVAVKDTFLWYKEAFWKRNYLMLLGAGGIVVSILALSSRLLLICNYWDEEHDRLEY
ncbi:uncharacterized protein LOC111388505 isoform X2 [Olea europaea var. sylvestris]|uniref:uncharacterized protein LOC111388505 isoform X2 n=1 Tax=Olea europaea var. sylvestris TaxID=158386 RepID=UPI000C1D3091|nr:uncharacterized protein LOC111388505 isoform X2 [Olea europaea var. sylvestris]